MAGIICQVCGEHNPDGQEVCQFCQTRLVPRKGEGSSHRLRDLAARTSDPDPERLLPEWLREERRLARGQPKAPETAKPETPVGQTDLLAGLRAQRTEESDDGASWFDRLVGSSSPAPGGEPEPDWTDGDAPKEIPSQADLPDTRAKSQPGPLPRADRPTHPMADRPTQARPDGLVYRVMGREVTDSEPVPEIPPLESKPAHTESPVSTSDVAPDWLLRLQEQQAAAEAAAKPGSSIPKEIEARLEITTRPKGPAALPDWLAPPAQAAADDEPIESQLPEWLTPPEAPSSTDDTPFTDVSRSEPPAARFESVTGRIAGLASEPRLAPKTPPGPTAGSAGAPASAKKITGDPLGGDSLDALFIDLPEWLSGGPEGEERPDEPAAADAVNGDLPAALPGWVAAMRPGGAKEEAPKPKRRGRPPVKEPTPPPAARAKLTPTLEATGPIRPKAYAIKLQASTHQQAHAALLDQVLVAEDTPQPMQLSAPVRSQRPLRWAIAGALWIIILAALLSHSQAFRLPPTRPGAAMQALEIAQKIPEAAPVLVAIDYAAARAGEMETSAAPLLDQMMLLRHPRVTFISTSPTGSLLAERLMVGVLAVRGYRSGVNYANLGFLPGGALGVRAFAQDPRAAMPLGMDAAPPWNSMPLRDVHSLTDYAALIIVTDDAGIARTWIEQTGDLRGDARMLVVSSDQAAPMIHPYYRAGQIHGLVAGLRGGAILEQGNAGLPGDARSQWDAFSLGVLLSALALGGGALWYLATGLRAGWRPEAA